MTSVAGQLSASQLQQMQEQAKNIANAAQKTIADNQFVFVAGFDGTNNDKSRPAPGEQSTNVGQLSDQAVAKENIAVGYYPGPGTEGTITGSSVIPAAVTAEAVRTANKAYAEFAFAASEWLKTHPNGEVTTTVNTFSRGYNAGAVFSQLVYERGLIDPNTKAVLIAPGKIGVSAGVLFDPVATGMEGNAAFAPNTKNVIVIQAENEYRIKFEAVDVSQHHGMKIFKYLGNHCDIGGSYDNGIAGLILEAVTQFLKNAGQSIADVPTERQFRVDPTTSKVNVHSEAVDEYGNTIWSAYNDWDNFSHGTDLTARPTKSIYVTPPTIEVSADGTKTIHFTAQSGNLITEVQSPSKNIFTVREPDGTCNITASGDVGKLAQLNSKIHFTKGTSAELFGNGLDIDDAGACKLAVTGNNMLVNTGEGSSLTIGGNGQYATQALNVFGKATEFIISDNSRVDFAVNNATITAGENDNFGCYGSGLTILGRSSSNVWTGGNGSSGVTNSIYGDGVTTTISSHSRADIKGNDVVVHAGSYDNFGVTGDRANIYATGSCNAWIGGRNDTFTGDRGVLTLQAASTVLTTHGDGITYLADSWVTGSTFVAHGNNAVMAASNNNMWHSPDSTDTSLRRI